MDSGSGTRRAYAEEIRNVEPRIGAGQCFTPCNSPRQWPNLMRGYGTGLQIAPSEVGASAPTLWVASKGLLSPEASGAEAPECVTVNVGAEAPTSEGLVPLHEPSN